MKKDTSESRILQAVLLLSLVGIIAAGFSLPDFPPDYPPSVPAGYQITSNGKWFRWTNPSGDTGLWSWDSKEEAIDSAWRIFERDRQEKTTPWAVVAK